MTALMVALHLLAVVPADSSLLLPDSTGVARRVVPMEEMVVRAPLHDLRSSQTVRVIGPSYRSLPADRVADWVALQAGVVARGEALHVRGGRAGDLRIVLEGIDLAEPQRDRAIEIPLLAVRSAEFVTGGIEAQYGGAMAGVLDVRTVDAGKRTEAEFRWRTDGGLDTRYDQVSGRLSTPLAGGWGAVAVAEATLDGTHLPSLRTQSRREILGGSWGWRDDNRLLGFFKLASPGVTPLGTLQVLASRRVTRPYDPMWSVDGYVNFCADANCTYWDVRPSPGPGYEYYRAADHKTMSDARSLATLLTLATPAAPWRARLTAGRIDSRSVTSLDGRDDWSSIDRTTLPRFGHFEDPHTEPLFAYAGDEPYFRDAWSKEWTARAEAAFRNPRGNGVNFGAGASYVEAESWEFDLSLASARPGLDSVRTLKAYAPGGYAFAQGRWAFQGLTVNAGLRAQYFHPGNPVGRAASTEAEHGPEPAGGVWNLAPRLGMSFPISVRDALSLSYVRLHQDPAREFLHDSRWLPPPNRHPLGNPLLEPSVTISWELGIKHVFTHAWSAQLGLFQRDQYGQIGARNDPPFPRIYRLRYENADVGHAEGFELSAYWVPGERTRVEAHYTHLRAWGTQSREEGLPYGTNLGERSTPLGEHALDWDRRHTISWAGQWQPFSSLWLSAASTIGSPLPWTPRDRRTLESSQDRINSGRLGWTENTVCAVRAAPWREIPVVIGVEVHNLFDWRGDLRSTVDGYPHPIINTVYDDYSAYRNETGRGGGAYWDDTSGDRVPGWVPVHDPRLAGAPRTIRFGVDARF